MSAKAAKTASSPVEDDDTPAPTLRDVRHLAEVLAPFLARQLAPILSARDNVAAADVSPRQGGRRMKDGAAKKGRARPWTISTRRKMATHRGWTRRRKTRRSMRAKRKRNGSRSGVTQELQGAEERTIGDAKKEYAMYSGTTKENKPGSVEDTT